MRIGVLGINFKSSDLALRERIAKATLRCLSGESSEVANLSVIPLYTCNRTEIYFSHEDLAAVHSELLALLRTEIDLPFEHKLYSYFGGECFNHLAHVTAGLDSLIPCETEIQRQVKMAYSNACLHRSLPSSMHFLFQKSLKIGKWIRSSLPSPFRQISLGTQLFQLICSTLDKPSLFFLGNSEINRKIIAFFNAQERYQITLCTRSPHSAEEFAKKQHIQCVGWDALTQWQNHDVVICGTNHHEYLIVPEQIVHPPKTKFIFDLGIPRNTDPRFSFHPHITLMNIEDLGHFMKVRREEEKEAIKQMSEQVRQAVDKQLFIFNSKTQQATQCV